MMWLLYWVIHKGAVETTCDLPRMYVCMGSLVQERERKS